MLSAIYSGLIYNMGVKYFPSFRRCYQFQEFRKYNQIKLEPMTYIKKYDDIGYLNYFVFSKLGIQLYNIDNTIRLLFLLIYMGTSLYILL